MQEQYRKANDKIHAPQELLNATRQQMKAEKKRRRTARFIRYGAAAACFCLVAFGIWKYTGRDRIYIEEVQLSRQEWTIGKNLGNADVSADGRDKESDSFTLHSGETKETAPEEIWDLQASTVKRTKVYIGKTGDETWAAAYEKEGIYYYLEGTDISEDEFLNYLRNNL